MPSCFQKKVTMMHGRDYDNGVSCMKTWISFFWSGKPKGERRETGVGFAIKKNIITKLTEMARPVSDRIRMIRLPLSKDNFATIIISVYAPTMTSGLWLWANMELGNATPCALSLNWQWWTPCSSRRINARPPGCILVRNIGIWSTSLSRGVGIRWTSEHPSYAWSKLLDRPPDAEVKSGFQNKYEKSTTGNGQISRPSSTLQN